MKKLLFSGLAGFFLLPVFSQEKPSGVYFGEYKITMNTPANSGAPALWRINSKTPAQRDIAYGVLGWSAGKSYWLWDFDKKTVRLGGGALWALEQMSPSFQLYSLKHSKVEGQTNPDIDIPVDDVTADFYENQDGTYTLTFNYQIYFGLAGYPHAKISSKYNVAFDEDNNLLIRTLDESPDGVGIPKEFIEDSIGQYDGIYQSTGGAVSDGIPGVTRASATEDPAGGVFPFRVSPQYDSVKMLKVDSAKDCNKDGIPDAVSVVLRLDPCVSDNDGDGVNDVDEIGASWVNPLDSDQNGVPDIFEVGDNNKNLTVASNIVLANGEKVTLSVKDGNRIGNAQFPRGVNTYPLSSRWFNEADNLVSFELGEVSPLPEKNGSGSSYRYNMGGLDYGVTLFFAPYSVFNVLNKIVSEKEQAPLSILNAESSVEIYQERYSNNPTSTNLARLNNAIAALERAKANAENINNLAPRLLEVYRSKIIDYLGVEFLNVNTKSELDGLLQAKGIDPEVDLDKHAEVYLQFEKGVPEGFKIFSYMEYGAKQKLPDGYMPSQTEGFRAGAAWAPIFEENVPFEIVDQNTVKINYTNITASSNFNPFLIDEPPSFDTEDNSVAGAWFIRLILAYTGDERAFEVSLPSEPDPEPTPEPEESSGGGGSVGWLAGLLLGGFAARQWRRRGQATVRH